MFVGKKTENKRKRGRGWPMQKRRKRGEEWPNKKQERQFMKDFNKFV